MKGEIVDFIAAALVLLVVAVIILVVVVVIGVWLIFISHVVLILRYQWQMQVKQK